MKFFILFVHCIYLLFNSNFVIAEGAGIRLTYLGATINIRYNDNVEDKITGVNYIREPSGALFDTIYLLQNSNILKEAINIDVEIDNHSGSLWIYKSKPVKKVLLDKNQLTSLNSKDIRLTLCKEFEATNCTPAKDATIELYLSNSNLSNTTSDLVEYGCFPCNNDRTIALTDLYRDKNNPYPPKFKKVSVNRSSIYHYFNKLRE